MLSFGKGSTHHSVCYLTKMILMDRGLCDDKLGIVHDGDASSPFGWLAFMFLPGLVQGSLTLSLTRNFGCDQIETNCRRHLK